MSVGKNLLGKKENHCIAVIGDGAITGGMAYEAMNNAAYINSKILVVLNDNGQVSLPTGQPSAGGIVPAGALSGYTSRLLTSTAFKNVRDLAKSINTLLPDDIRVRHLSSTRALLRLIVTSDLSFHTINSLYVANSFSDIVCVPFLFSFPEHQQAC